MERRLTKRQLTRCIKDITDILDRQGKDIARTMELFTFYLKGANEIDKNIMDAIENRDKEIQKCFDEIGVAIEDSIKMVYSHEIKTCIGN